MSTLSKPRVTGLLRWFLASASLTAVGCTQIGPGTIANGRFDYNQAIVRSFDNQMLLNLVRLRYQDAQRAFLEVFYRDHWFYIDDADLESKSTYTLLAQLFSLQSASGSMQAPLLTIPAR